jgi:hypothetical protein
VVRAVADFNSSHLRPDRRFRPSEVGERVPVPPAAEVRRALGVDAAAAREIVRTLRGVEARWTVLRDQVYRSGSCLCHMDLGPGNISFRRGIGIIQDFGHAAAAPIGSDLHTVLRYGGLDSHGIDGVIAAYAGVFAEKGIEVDAGSVRRALEAHFAARYRDLRLPSARPAAFRQAVGMSLALLGPEAADPPRAGGRTAE